MFAGRLKERDMESIPLHDVDPNHFDLILDLFYGKRVEMNLETIVEVTKRLQFYGVDMISLDQLLDSISVDKKLIESPHHYLELIQLIHGEIDQKYIDRIASKTTSDVDLKPLFYLSSELFFQLNDSPKWTFPSSYLTDTIRQLIDQLADQKDAIGLIKLTDQLKLIEEKEKIKGEKLKEMLRNTGPGRTPSGSTGGAPSRGTGGGPMGIAGPSLFTWPHF
jgi:hypothetical protein